MWFFKKKKNENIEEKQLPSAEQIIKDAENLRQDEENKEDIPDIICAFYSATQNIDLDVDYVKEILNKSKNDNLNN